MFIKKKQNLMFFLSRLELKVLSVCLSCFTPPSYRLVHVTILFSGLGGGVFVVECICYCEHLKFLMCFKNRISCYCRFLFCFFNCNLHSWQ